jgi:hypothetical protein
VKRTQPARMNCDGIARYYQVIENLSFGRYLERRRFAFLGEVRTSRRAVGGGGDGRFLDRLLRVNSHVEVDFVDLSPKMVELAERRVAGMGRTCRERVRFRVRDVGIRAANGWLRFDRDALLSGLFLGAGTCPVSALTMHLARYATIFASTMDFGNQNGCHVRKHSFQHG